MKKTTVLSVDLGASSGRVIAVTLDGDSLTQQELHRFENGGIAAHGRIYTDVLYLYREILTGLAAARKQGLVPEGIAVDVWGVDFCLLDRDGEPVHQPWFYRDQQTAGMPEKADARFGRGGLFRLTGVQDMWYNTTYQLMGIEARKPGFLKRADTFLMLADMLCYLLCGEKSLEYTAVSTSQLFDLAGRRFPPELLQGLGLDEDLFPPVRLPGEIKGYLCAEVLRHAGFPEDLRIPVFAGCEHDSAAAAFSVPSEEENYLFLSSGTWSIIGTVIDEPLVTEAVYRSGFSNEGAAFGKVKLVRSIMGMWLIQELRKSWAKQGLPTDYETLIQAAEEAPPFTHTIDVSDASFEAPADMQDAVNDWFIRTGQTPVSDPGILYRTVLESLGATYRGAIDELERLTGRTFPVLHVIGGSVQDPLFCRLIADATGRTLVTGPVEGTSLGNALIQLMALGRVNGRAEAVQLIRRSQDIRTWEPTGSR